MINLIPSEEKKKIRKDFYMRVVIVSFFVLGIAILLSNIMLIPAVFYASLEKTLVENHFNNNQNQLSLELNPEDKTLVDSLNSKINLVNNFQKDKFLVSVRVIDNILNRKTDGIKIKDINYTNDVSKGKSINIRGQASSREKLVIFKNKLSEDANFKKVDLPVSNFIKSSDIEFNLVLIPS